MTTEQASGGGNAVGTPRKQLSLFDSTCLIVGIIIGAGVYVMSPMIAQGARCWWGVLAIWTVGGLLSLCGAVGYAELATAHPREGGDYVYLSRAYGRWAGFLFGWIQLAVVRPGDIAVMAFAFAMYAQRIYDPLADTAFPHSRQIYAIAATAVLTAINIVGVREGKWTQNILTSVKALGLLGIVIVALLAPDSSKETRSAFPGHWNIVSASPGDAEYLNEEAHPSIRLGGRGTGNFKFGDAKGDVEYVVVERDGKETVEFSLDGQDKSRAVSGSGLAALERDELKGNMSIAPGEDSDFLGNRLILPLSLAMIFVLFSFGGWNEMAYVAAEVKNPRRNIVRALVLGTAAVTVLYLLLNGAFLYAMGYYGLTASDAVAADAVSIGFPKIGSRLISALICISALGAVNGLVFAGARISYAMGADYRLFRVLGVWNSRTGTPAWALFVQGAITILLIATLATFEDTVLYTAAPVYAFFLATSLAVIVLRFKEPHVERPYRATGYPVTTILFCAVCGFLIYSAVLYRPWIAAAALGILSLGLPLFWISRLWPSVQAGAK